MIQDIEPYKFNNQYTPQAPKEDSFVLMYENRQVWVKEEEGNIDFPTFKDLEKQEEGIRERGVYLFSIDDKKFFMVRDLDTTKFEGMKYEPLNYLRTASPKYLAFAGATGHQLYTWYQSRRYCGRCGTPMLHDGKERMMYCESCGNREYPKICPAVIVGIINGDKLLLSKYVGREYKRYALIAGFTEIGETMEETVRREVMEEVGLKVKNIRFYKSQPWAFTDTILMGFYCDLDGEEGITLDRQELALAEWVFREDIPDEGENISLTKEMMMNFKNGGHC
ncbi:MAG: NAD(+) diphosphatase [Eubacteriales bacterium]|nr:NAD(+) diphosphatase [Eubacteriales bacterium]